MCSFTLAEKRRLGLKISSSALEPPTLTGGLCVQKIFVNPALRLELADFIFVILVFPVLFLLLVLFCIHL